MTEGILLCSSESDLVKIATTILSARSLAAHPAALGTIVCGFLADVLDYKIETSWAETYVLETASGQSGLLLAGGNLNNTTTATVSVRPPESAYQLMTLRLHNAAGGPDTEANELPVLQSGTCSQAVPDATITLQTGMENPQDWEQQLALSRKSVGLAQLALAWETYSQTLVRLTKLVEQFLLQTKTLMTAENTDCNEEQLPVRERQRIAVQQQVDYLSQRAADLVA